jgi:hypothetical protein
MRKNPKKRWSVRVKRNKQQTFRKGKFYPPTDPPTPLVINKAIYPQLASSILWLNFSGRVKTLAGKFTLVIQISFTTPAEGESVLQLSVYGRELVQL